MSGLLLYRDNRQLSKRMCTGVPAVFEAPAEQIHNSRNARVSASSILFCSGKYDKLESAENEIIRRVSNV